MTEKEIVQKIYEAIKLVDCMQYNPLVDFNYLRAKCAYNIIKNQVEHIEAENAALRERLEKAILGKYIYYINSVWNDATMTRKEKVCQGAIDYACDNFVEVAGLVLKWEEIYFTREAVLARLAELKGEAK